MSTTDGSRVPFAVSSGEGYREARPRNILKTISLVACLSSALSASAADVIYKIYKSVDAQGNITYSATPPDSAVRTSEIPVEAGPSEADRREAEQRERQLERAATRAKTDLDVGRARRVSRVTAAEQELELARSRLEEARTQHDTDWQGLVQGGRHLKAEYFARVEAAEEAVRQAEEALTKARRDAN
jgi:hypothetical protein